MRREPVGASVPDLTLLATAGGATSVAITVGVRYLRRACRAAAALHGALLPGTRVMTRLGGTELHLTIETPGTHAHRMEPPR
ncbi:MAG: hypothetical protein JWN52_4451 [Actinomycetia bacterium]|nr:hypothetical protein [Actinomycetes bacterium]